MDDATGSSKAAPGSPLAAEVETYAASLHRSVVHILRRRHRALGPFARDDVAQDVVLRFLEDPLPVMESYGQPWVYALASLRSRASDFERRERAQRGEGARLVASATACAPDGSRCRSTTDTAVRWSGLADRRPPVGPGAGARPHGGRADPVVPHRARARVLLGVDGYDYSVAEIAEILCLRRETVSRLLNRVRPSHPGHRAGGRRRGPAVDGGADVTAVAATASAPAVVPATLRYRPSATCSRRRSASTDHTTVASSPSMPTSRSCGRTCRRHRRARRPAHAARLAVVRSSRRRPARGARRRRSRTRGPRRRGIASVDSLACRARWVVGATIELPAASLTAPRQHDTSTDTSTDTATDAPAHAARRASAAVLADDLRAWHARSVNAHLVSDVTDPVASAVLAASLDELALAVASGRRRPAARPPSWRPCGDASLSPPGNASNCGRCWWRSATSTRGPALGSAPPPLGRHRTVGGGGRVARSRRAGHVTSASSRCVQSSMGRRSTFWTRTFEAAGQPASGTGSTASTPGRRLHRSRRTIACAHRRHPTVSGCGGILPGEQWETRWETRRGRAGGGHVVWIRVVVRDPTPRSLDPWLDGSRRRSPHRPSPWSAHPREAVAGRGVPPARGRGVHQRPDVGHQASVPDGAAVRRSAVGGCVVRSVRPRCSDGSPACARCRSTSARTTPNSPATSPPRPTTCNVRSPWRPTCRPRRAGARCATSASASTRSRRR